MYTFSATYISTVCGGKSLSREALTQPINHNGCPVTVSRGPSSTAVCENL